MEKAFYEVLSTAQEFISKNYGSLLDNNKDDTTEQLESYLLQYIDLQQIEVEALSSKELIQKLVDEMMRFAFLTPYLTSDTVEEININGWDDVKVTYANGSVAASEESFRSPDHAIDIIRRLLRESNMTWDNASCVQVGFLQGNIRITAAGFDVVDAGKRLSVSIRKVNPKNLKKDDFISNATATEDMLNLLSLFHVHGISLCFAGATGSGKTTLLAYVLSCVPYDKRLITIEEGTHDLTGTVRDASGKVLNNVVHLLTRHSNDPNEDFSQARLLEASLTMNPDFIAMGESKSHEAMQIVNAANTGQSVSTTIHANSCEDTYFRFMSLCKLAYPNMDEMFLMTLAARAFPLVAFTKQLEDHSRKIMQINEAICKSDGTIEYSILYRYVITSTKKIDGKLKIEGHFEQGNRPSSALRQRLVDGGLSTAWINYFCKEFKTEGL